MSGTFYVIGTPIGNLEDITLRQLDTLAAVDFICAEDTRVTLKLLNRFDIKKQLISFHEHSSKADAQRIIDRLLAGESCGIVTDAGMPCISDPGEVLVKLCAEQGIDIKVVPGPSAVVSAVAVSGLSTRRFTFEGFLPVPKKERAERLEKLRGETAVMVFYEAPHKLKTTLADLYGFFGGDRRIALCRELTKIHEEVIRLTLSEAVEYYNINEPKGEFVLVLEGSSEDAEDGITIEQAMEQVMKLIDMGEKPTEACKAVAKETGFRKSELYAKLQ
ncbi:16S rRNA (cytidine(1402)-2'-O)-methyltransferase [Ruminococcus flavefaciens]|uniref:Ribosomal RNA small subunit methyltransferase I n=1 Tax=Ruminococcus flavefaciens TaxID=1265 RepID=A0A315XUN1_RUMFL|nr:16S rRNA (cytidine(1402)-2'-O)-methyltransferase [Ruminococcus flavefaciens]PWJ10747.1 16S rRNA (cytidine1402-2'-O)-methyltransferase [Ruminococcus flavefaciens]SSA51323.1 16S rRNA (cytidine1402-2'-O)-methyltransferase [Ruminococcus flavefaciens]